MAATAWNAAPALARDLLGDERLARLAARGDQRAFDSLFSRYRHDLERYCRSILRNAADAEDAAQNAMVAAHRALEGGTTPMRVKPWLYKIAHNEAISLARRRRPAEELDDTVIGASSAGAEDATAIRERLGQLLADLKALTDRQREALVLRELCGLSYGEIAETLGSSEAAAQQTVFEARSALVAFGEGRALDCERIQRAMSECDGMRLRTRLFRAHVRGCPGCREFEATLLARRRDLGLLFPSTTGAAGVLAGLARLLGIGGGGERIAAALGLKGAAIGAALLAGGGAVVLATTGSGPSRSREAGFRQPTAGAAVAPAPASGSAASRAKAPRGAAGARHVAPKHARPHHGTATKPTTSAASPAAPAAGTPASTPTSGPTQLASANTQSTDAASRAGATTGGPTTSTGGSHPVSSAVQQTAAAVGQTVDNTVTTVTNAATQAVGDVSNAIDQTTTTATGAVDTTVTTATDVIKKTTGGLGSGLP